MRGCQWKMKSERQSTYLVYQWNWRCQTLCLSEFSKMFLLCSFPFANRKMCFIVIALNKIYTELSKWYTLIVVDTDAHQFYIIWKMSWKMTIRQVFILSVRQINSHTIHRSLCHQIRRLATSLRKFKLKFGYAVVKRPIDEYMMYVELVSKTTLNNITEKIMNSEYVLAQIMHIYTLELYKCWNAPSFQFSVK